MSKVLELKNIEKTFYAGTVNENYVIKNLSLDLEDGDYVTVIGGNGAGKSTMLNIISGALLPDSGSVTIDGYIKDKAYLATVLSYDKESGEALFTQRNKMCVGDDIELLTPGRVGIPLKAGELFDEEHKPIESTCHPYMKFYMRMPFEVKDGDIIRLA